MNNIKALDNAGIEYTLRNGEGDGLVYITIPEFGIETYAADKEDLSIAIIEAMMGLLRIYIKEEEKTSEYLSKDWGFRDY